MFSRQRQDPKENIVIVTVTKTLVLKDFVENNATNGETCRLDIFLGCHGYLKFLSLGAHAGKRQKHIGRIPEGKEWWLQNCVVFLWFLDKFWVSGLRVDVSTTLSSTTKTCGVGGCGRPLHAKRDK